MPQRKLELELEITAGAFVEVKQNDWKIQLESAQSSARGWSKLQLPQDHVTAEKLQAHGGSGWTTVMCKVISQCKKQVNSGFRWLLASTSLCN